MTDQAIAQATDRLKQNHYAREGCRQFLRRISIWSTGLRHRHPPRIVRVHGSFCRQINRMQWRWSFAPLFVTRTKRGRAKPRDRTEAVGGTIVGRATGGS